MNKKIDTFLYKDLTHKIIGLAMEVHSYLGCGFLEKVYENSLMVQFRNNNIKAIQQAPIKVYFKSEIVGDYIADILVEDKVILELKASDAIADIHRAQIINYLKATKYKIGYLLNFGAKKLEFERFVNVNEINKDETTD
jgi:GxxExxY protein